MNGNLPAPTIDGSFAHHWQAEILANRPLILPKRHFVYPTQAEEVERGALEVLVRPSRNEAEFLATCALGFRDPAVPTGLWSTPNPDELCAVSGGYAYIIDTVAPERFTMIAFRPVLEIRPVLGLSQHCCTHLELGAPGPSSAAGGGTGDCTQSSENALSAGLLLFVGHHSILAWGKDGQAWQSEKLSSEGVTITSFDGHRLIGQGWNMMTDKETPFALDLRTGLREG